MKNNFYSKGIIVIRKLIKIFSIRYKIIYSSMQQIPAVYIVHHQNLNGPITSILWLNTHLHMWVLSPFLNRRSCYNHYVNYTFTKRFGMSRVLASIIAFPVSFFVSWLLNSIKAVSVYRGKREIVLTFKQSVTALIKGESLLISPDIEYTDTGSDMGEMYDGFLNIDKYYVKETNKHIAFIPVHINQKSHSIYIGNSVQFNDNGLFKDEKKEIMEKLKNEFKRLQNLLG